MADMINVREIFLKNMGYVGEKWLTRSCAEGMEGIARGVVDAARRENKGEMAGIGKVFVCTECNH